MSRELAWSIFEANYDSFLEDFIQDMRDHDLTLEDACLVWEDYFGYDAQDPLVDWAVQHHYQWAFPEGLK